MAKPKDKQPWFKFYPQDWRGDAKLRMCSIGARGLWAEMLCVMHEAEPYGYLTISGKAVTPRQMAALAGVSQGECMKYMLELASAGVYSIDDDKTIFSRRMVRDKAKSEKAKEDGASGGNPEIRRGSVPKEQRVRPFKRSDAPEKTRRIFQKSNGRCHWCDVPLIFQPTGEETNGYHVDHVLAVCDGGTNEEANLVAACSACNHKRARNSYSGPPEVKVGNKSDSKPQRPDAISQNQISESRERELSPSNEFSGKQEGEATPITDKYEPSSPAVEYAYSLGMKKIDLETELGKFRSRALALRQVSFDHDMSFKLWCDRWLQYQKKNFPERYAEPAPAPAAIKPKVFVESGTLAWQCWQSESRRTGGRGYPCVTHRVDHSSKDGFWFETEFPPGYDEQTGERLPAGEEHAA